MPEKWEGLRLAWRQAISHNPKVGIG